MVTHQQLGPIFVSILGIGVAVLVNSASTLGQDAAQSVVAGASAGPDVFVWNIPGGTYNYGSNTVESVEFAAFAIGTDSCNAGDANLIWIAGSDDHPVIRQGLYRRRVVDENLQPVNRFEQIGTSWVKHGFYATNENDCSQDCVPFEPGWQLAPNCSDLYSASLNGDRQYLGPSSDINAFTGQFPWPPTLPAPNVQGDNVGYRMHARHTDIDPALNPGAKFFVDAHYVTADDAAAGNAENNVSYRAAFFRTFISPTSPVCSKPYCLAIDTLQPTRTMMPVIYAWQALDPTAQISEQRVPGEGLFILGSHVQDLGNGFWRYEYALYNMNSHRSAASFSIPLPENAIVQNMGFHDVDYGIHERWDGTDWPPTFVGNDLVWQTTPYDIDPNANALRWSTTYNFRFEVNAPPTGPVDSHVDVGLFRPGQPTGISIRCQGPSLTFIDCNQNGIEDRCDVDCQQLGCDQQTCGQSDDCNENGVPDDPLCEVDCNENGLPDECDIADCPPGDLSCGDCNNNTVPDGCDDDCDQDGEPDNCEEDLDCDDDGTEDCQDLCPCNTPPNGCSLPDIVTCRFGGPGSFCADTSPANCAAFFGTPMCGEPPEERCDFGYPCPDSVCRDGCLVGDFDLDGDRDFFDFRAFQGCFSSPSGGPAYAEPPSECLMRFDVEADGDIDWTDFQRFQSVLGDP